MLAWQVLFFGPSDLFEPSTSFSAVVGRLIVSPVVRTLVFSRLPKSTRRYPLPLAPARPQHRLFPLFACWPSEAVPRVAGAAVYCTSRTCKTLVLNISTSVLMSASFATVRSLLRCSPLDNAGACTRQFARPAPKPHTSVLSGQATAFAMHTNAACSVVRSSVCNFQVQLRASAHTTSKRPAKS